MILCNSRLRGETPEGHRPGGLGLPKRDRLPVTMPRVRHALACFVALPAAAAHACDSGAVALFGCDAAQSRKFIELCAPAPLDTKSGYLVYRFGSLNEDGEQKSIELEYPVDPTGSLKRFYGATYTHAGVYTQSVRFVSGNFGYTVFTRSRALTPSLPESKCATAKAEKSRSLHATSGPVSTSSSSRASWRAIRKRL